MRLSAQEQLRFAASYAACQMRHIGPKPIAALQAAVTRCTAAELDPPHRPLLTAARHFLEAPEDEKRQTHFLKTWNELAPQKEQQPAAPYWWQRGAMA